MGKSLVADCNDPLYGKVCQCGGRKTLNAAMCKKCRDDEKRGKPVLGKHYDCAMLSEVWHMPVMYPPLGAGAPRVHGYSRTEPD